MSPKTCCLVAALLVVAACSKPAPETSQAMAPAASVATEASAAAGNAVPQGSATLVSSPASVRRCEASDGNAVVSLSWDAAAAGVPFVTVKADGKVLAEGHASGSAATGPWVRDDTVFTLVDSANGALLATLKIPFVDC